MNGVLGAIVNAGAGAWAFDDHARRLSRAMRLPIISGEGTISADYVYLLGLEQEEPPDCRALFIPYEAILLASDKRGLAEAFDRHGVATPRAYLLETPEEVQELIRRETQTQWVLKWPTGCGASGHRLQQADDPLPENWPRPYILQEFIRLAQPEVYRLYGVAGETFGWNARRFPSGVPSSPWVAHARGARYEKAGVVPPEAESQARRALAAAGLRESFGCVDLLRRDNGQWLVLEVNTDGIVSFVDRDIGLPGLADEIDQRLGRAFWNWMNSQA